MVKLTKKIEIDKANLEDFALAHGWTDTIADGGKTKVVFAWDLIAHQIKTSVKNYRIKTAQATAKATEEAKPTISVTITDVAQL